MSVLQNRAKHRLLPASLSVVEDGYRFNANPPPGVEKTLQRKQ
jgi:hypothetical protein